MSDVVRFAATVVQGGYPTNAEIAVARLRAYTHDDLSLLDAAVEMARFRSQRRRSLLLAVELLDQTVRDVASDKAQDATPIPA